jgi:hypothetical protein
MVEFNHQQVKSPRKPSVGQATLACALPRTNTSQEAFQRRYQRQKHAYNQGKARLTPRYRLGVYVCVCLYVHTHTQDDTETHMHAHARTHVHIHAYVHIFTYAKKAKPRQSRNACNLKD